MSKVPKRPGLAKAARPRTKKPPAERAPRSLVRIPFHGGELEAFRDNGHVWISIRRVCDALGLRVEGQAAKLRTKPWATTEVIYVVAEDGKSREAVCVGLDALPMWLATIDVGRVKADAREQLDVYQRDAARVLREHFFPKLPAPAAPAPPGPSVFTSTMALERLSLASALLDQAEHDLAALSRWDRDDPKPHALTAPISTTLSLVRLDVKGTRYALCSPEVQAKWKAVLDRWQALSESFGEMIRT